MNREDVVKFPAGFTGTRVALFSSWNDAYAPLADIARPNWKAYCELHGYMLRLYPGEYHLDPSRPETYGDKNKFDLYYDLRGHCDTAMFLDIDSLFMNMNTNVPDAYPFLWSFDDNGPLSGLWIAKTDETTEKHLRYAYAKAATENNVRHGMIEPNGISDQDSMTRIMNTPPFDRTFGTCVPAKKLGHLYESNYFDGGWIITFPGLPVEQKLERMQDWSQRVSTTV